MRHFWRTKFAVFYFLCTRINFCASQTHWRHITRSLALSVRGAFERKNLPNFCLFFLIFSSFFWFFPSFSLFFANFLLSRGHSTPSFRPPAWSFCTEYPSPQAYNVLLTLSEESSLLGSFLPVPWWCWQFQIELLLELVEISRSARKWAPRNSMWRPAYRNVKLHEQLRLSRKQHWVCGL